MDNVAILDGFTQEIIATSSEHDLYLLVKPGTDFESTFKAWDTDGQEYIRVNGWLYSVEKTSLKLWCDIRSGMWRVMRDGPLSGWHEVFSATTKDTCESWMRDNPL